MLTRVLVDFATFSIHSEGKNNAAERTLKFQFIDHIQLLNFNTHK